MNNKIYLLLVFFFGVLGMNAQSDYYYYNNEKVYVDIDTRFVSVNSSKGTTDHLKSASIAYLRVTPVVEDNARKYLTGTEPKANQKSYYYEIELTDDIGNNKANYSSYLNRLNAISDISKVSPVYKTKSGKRLGLYDKFYVKLKKASDASELYAYAANNNLEVLGKDPYMPLWYVISCAKNNPKNALELANQFYETNKFATAEPAFAYHDLQASVDPLFNNQWGLKNTGQYGTAYAGIDIKAEQAWTIATGTNVKTAIFDQGFEMNHPDLSANNFGTGFDANNGVPPSTIRGNHGTACAGITGAVQNNNLGGSGVAPNTKLVSISINLSFSDTPLQLASGFSWARTNGVDIISNSWGGYTPSSVITDAITDAINLGRGGKGCVVVFAAGNENNTAIRYPGSALPNILVVGAMSPCGQRKSFTSCDGENFWGSCYGTQLDVVAPGVKMATTDRQGVPGYTTTDYTPDFNGTSSACPVVAGVCALILSANPCLTSKQVRDIIEQTSQKVGGYSYTTTVGRPNGTWNNEMGYGLVNAYAAVQMAQQMYSASLDLYVKDTSADIGTQPNNISPYMWASEDIWVRNYADNGLVHQNPDYSPTNPNYIYVRVRNKSCVASLGTEKLKLYWAKAGTSLSWPLNWNGTLFQSGVLMGAPTGTLNIPVLQPGQEVILQFAWNVPNPSNYFPINSDPWHFCLLARVEATNDPMAIAETTDLNMNVKNNNNIAWKNVTVVDILANGGIGGVVGVGNPTRVPKKYTLEFVADVPQGGRPIFEQAEVAVKMDDRLLRAWRAGGGNARGFENTGEENRKIVRGNNATLNNIYFEPNELGTLNLTFNFLTTTVTDQTDFVFNIVQKDAETGAVVGGETYMITKGKERARLVTADAGSDVRADKNEVVTLSAAQINEAAIYNWYDASGKLVYQGKDLTVSVDVAKKYKLEVIALADGFKDYAEVKVNLNPSSLDIMAPNPTKNNVTIGYKLNGASSAYLMIVGSYGAKASSNNYILDMNSTETTINVANYPQGLYTVALVCNGKIVDTKTLVKK